MKLYRTIMQGVLWALAVISLLALASPGWAADSCHYLNGWRHQKFSVPIQGKYTIPRDAAPGYLIASWSTPTPVSWPYAHCNRSGQRYWNLTALLPAVGSGLYQTDVAGVGVRVYNHFMADPLPTQMRLDANTDYYFPAPVVTYQLLVIGKVGAGKILGGRLPQLNYTFNNSLPIFSAQASGEVDIEVASCKTPDIFVDLGQHSVHDFSGINQPMRPPPVSFNLSILDCPAGLTHIFYQLDPTTSILGTGSGVVALDKQQSTARGIGVKLMDQLGQPLPFNKRIAVPWVVISGTQYTVPLQATFVQTEQTIQPGSANTSLIVTMSYQ